MAVSNIHILNLYLKYNISSFMIQNNLKIDAIQLKDVFAKVNNYSK